MSTLPLTLAIDTARDRLQLALVGAGSADDALVEPIARGHAEILLDRIGALLARNGRAYADLDRVAVATGPGSFTGVRIGLAAARGFGLALDIPVLGIPSLLALSLTREGETTLVVDARRGEAFVQAFSGPGLPAGPARLVPYEAALQEAGRKTPDDGVLDILAFARFAAAAEPAAFPPVPAYLRAADAKPQTRGKVARQ